MGIDPMGDLRSLGYEICGGRLQHTASGAPFKFEGPGHYDRLADAVVEYASLLLEDDVGLEPLWLPLGAPSGGGCPIYVSPDFLQCQKLLVLVNGAGRVRAGVWSCSLCINEDLDKGTMLPYIKAARAMGFGIAVLNPNTNQVDGRPIPGSESPERHVKYFWQHVLMAHDSRERRGPAVDVIAHSQGGRWVLSMLRRAQLYKEGSNRLGLNKVIFTDSYHVQQQVLRLPEEKRTFLSTKAVNFVPHDSAAGLDVQAWFSQEYSFTAEEKACRCVSAGVLDHASTNYAALELAMDFLLEPSCACELPGSPSTDAGSESWSTQSSCSLSGQCNNPDVIEINPIMDNPIMVNRVMDAARLGSGDGAEPPRRRSKTLWLVQRVAQLKAHCMKQARRRYQPSSVTKYSDI